MRLRLDLVPVAAVALVAAALNSGCRELEAVTTPHLTVSPTALVFDSVAIGDAAQLELRFENTGEATLEVRGFDVDTNTGYVVFDEGQDDTFRVAPGEAEYRTFTYQPLDPRQTSGVLRISTNDPDAAPMVLDIVTPTPAPRPIVIPAVLDFGVVGVNTTGEVSATVRNLGFAPLVICDAQLVGNVEFGSDIDAALAAATDAAVGHAVVSVFESGAGNDELVFTLTYSPSAPGQDSAELVIRYDSVGSLTSPCSEANIESVTYEVTGTAGTPLLGRDPCPLNFGERAIDVTHEESITLTNLGELDLELYDIRLDPSRSSPNFSLRDTPEVPLSLAPSDAASFTVTYRPDSLDAEAAVIEIEHSDAAGDRVISECRVAGVGSENDRPIAVAVGSVLQDSQNRRGEEIDWALPIQTLLLDGSGSYDPDGGAITDYFWDTVVAPDAALGGVGPSDLNPSPAYGQYFLPVSGRYQLCLTVTDDTGLSSEPDCVTVVVVPAEAISIELTWTNPDDPDESDETGADVDLHFVKMPNAWFDPVFDTFYANVAPNWSPETPSLDIDDTDGRGPETIQMDDPDQCTWYAVGVHYFRAINGTAWPTVKIYINGTLRDEIVNQPLESTDDFWDVARIHWPSQTVQRVNRLIPDFDSNEGIAPPVTDAMRASGLCDAF
ncbi:MAG: choice-of-anchor D domain-containing protein [Myxococcales bacterium]|nr:choice-of-anchor D domain-containing protein [Myxococcales bacterium]MCB9530512.1 choice-of-anchor D domain-containing protein [Myxococcales bacterium]